MAATVRPISLEEIVDEHEYDIVDELDVVDDLVRHLARGEAAHALLDGVVVVDPRAQEILRRRFGLDGDPQTLEEIGSY